MSRVVTRRKQKALATLLVCYVIKGVVFLHHRQDTNLETRQPQEPCHVPYRPDFESNCRQHTSYEAFRFVEDLGITLKGARVCP